MHWPIIVELSGPPGAGKSTLAKFILERYVHASKGEFPYFRKIKYAPFFIWNSILVIPTVLQLYFCNHVKPTLREIAFMVILTGWHHLLYKKSLNNRHIIVVDEGPICVLAKLYANQSPALASEGASQWWDKMYKQWSEILSCVIYLDTNEIELIKRIRSRDMWQEVKVLSDEEAIKYLGNIRNAHKHILSGVLSQQKKLKFIGIDTSIISYEDIYKKVIPSIMDLNDKI